MYIYIYIYIYIHIYVDIYGIYLYGYIRLYMLPFQRETEAQLIFLNPFTICTSCKQKFVVCPFVYEETNGCYLIANGLRG